MAAVTKLDVLLTDGTTHVFVTLGGADPNTVVNAIHRNGGVWSGTDPTTSVWYPESQIKSITPSA